MNTVLVNASAAQSGVSSQGGPQSTSTSNAGGGLGFGAGIGVGVAISEGVVLGTAALW